ncbi:MAG: polyprenyl synthetase family protein [Deltaproteobacteria bacterium]|nr:MAG: polyprenyl synthetase family protein [Deltaproteobacteria bacterium]
MCADRGLHDLATRLADLHAWIAADMDCVESDLTTVERGASVVHRCAHHLLDLGGKHLRPMCVALAAKVGDGFGPAARQLAVAVELIHSATLLHDDVVDLGDTRRGAPAARTVYGNAASIFAGDWLLVQALQRVQRAAIAGLLDRTLDTIDEMIRAEAIQLANRGRVNASRADYFAVVEGKTAALFRWAMYAGARAGGADEATCRALERYGLHLGVAFQTVDDLLDFAGDTAVTGKAVLTDLREGKMTYPLIVALDRAPELADTLAAIVAGADGDPVPQPLAERVLATLHATGALAEGRALAERRAADAIACLADLPDGRARTALVTVAEATVYRER